MQLKGGPRLLVTDRESALYLERARIHVEGSRVVYHIADDEHRREYNIPHVNLAVLFIGQGTSITQDAMRLLGEEGVHIAVTGTGGTPLHMGALTTYKATRHFRDLLPIWQNEELSLKAAKAVMLDRADRMRRIGALAAQRFLRQRDATSLTRLCTRFQDGIGTSTSISQLLGAEGNFAKACYAEFARMSGLSKDGAFRREAGSGVSGANLKSLAQQVNRLIDHGNYLCYGMAGAALWALGIPPHLSIFHGKTRAGGLVFDIADGFKDTLVLPLAFASVLNSKDSSPEQTFRGRMISAFDDHRILVEAIGTIDRMIAAAGGRKPDDHA